MLFLIRHFPIATNRKIRNTQQPAINRQMKSGMENRNKLYETQFYCKWKLGVDYCEWAAAVARLSLSRDAAQIWKAIKKM